MPVDPGELNDLLEMARGIGEAPPPQTPETGLRRYLQLGIRGATFGVAGTQIPAQNIPEAVTEFAGSIPTVAGASALLSPVGGAVARTVPLLRAPQIATPAARIVTAGLTGAGVGTTQALVEGKPPLPEAAKGAGQFMALESGFLGAAKLMGRALKAPPVGKTLTPSPVEDRAAEELARGAGMVPETPPVLNLPVVRSSGIFDAKDYVGSGRVLNPERNPQLQYGRILRPEEETRRMLPAGRPPLALPPGPEPVPEATPIVKPRPGPRITAAERAEAERQLAARPPFKDEYLATHFDEEFDPVVNRSVLIPKTPEIEEAVDLSLGIDPRKQGELPLTEAQIFHLEERRPDLKAKLDTVSKRENSLTDNLLKQPPETVDAATVRGEAPTMELHAVELSPAGLEAKTLIERAGIPEAEYVKFGATLRGTRDQKLSQLLDWLKTRCR